MKNPIKILIAQEGSAKTSILYTGLYHNDNPGHEYILVYCDLVKEQTGIPTTHTPQQPMRIDNTTLLPVVDAEGIPVIHTTETQTGIDAEGNPIYEDVETAVTIGEYDKTLWEHWDSRNPSPKLIETAIREGIQRRVLGLPIPFVFIQTQAWLDTMEL